MNIYSFNFSISRDYLFFIFLKAALSLFGVIGGPVLGLFCLGVFIPFANSKGAIVGTLTSLAVTIWIFVGSQVYGIKYPKKPMTLAGCNKTTSYFNSTVSSNTSEAVSYFNLTGSSYSSEAASYFTTTTTIAKTTSPVR